MIRRLAEEDMPAAMLLVDHIFFTEQDIPMWMNPIPKEKAPIWWGLFLDGELKGTVASYLDHGDRHMGRLTVVPELRSCRYGSKLVSQALNDLFADGVETVYMDARETTVHILLRMGGEIIGEPFVFYRGTCTPLRVRAEAFRQSLVEKPE